MRFMAECPNVEVQLISTNRRVDIIHEGIDIAIRVRFPPIEESDLVMKFLAHSPQRLIASPKVLADFGRPVLPADLNSFPTMAWGPPLGEHVWRLDGPEGSEATIRHAPRLVTEDMVTLRLAALRGVGIVQMPAFIVGSDIRDGRLVRVLPEWSPKAGIIHAVFPSRRGQLPSVRALLDYLAERYAELAREESS